MCGARIRFENEGVLLYYTYIYILMDLYEHRPLKEFTNCTGKFLEFDTA